MIPDVEVVEMTADEYQQAVTRALTDWGVTYAELATMAADDSFPTGQVRALWYAVRAYPGQEAS